MLTARVDIIGHTSDTVDIQIIVFPTELTDPQIGSVDVVDNSSPPLSLLGRPEQIPDCSPNFGVVTPFRIEGLPLTRLPIQVNVTICGTGETRMLGTFLEEMYPRPGAVPCSSSNNLVLPPSQQCRDAQNEVSSVRDRFLQECSNIEDARGRRDSAIAGAAATSAIGVGAFAGAAAIYAALVQAATAAAAAAAAAATIPIIGWIAVGVLAAIAVGFLIAAAVFLARYNDAQNDLNAARQRQIQNLQAFQQAVGRVRVSCCPQQVPSTLSLEIPTCP
jgi:hypothetical protein